MSALSIRRLPRDVERALVKEAERQGKTKTEIVLEALASRYGLSSQAKKREKLRSFFGKMSQAEFEAFQKATKPFSEIDPELWD